LHRHRALAGFGGELDVQGRALVEVADDEIGTSRETTKENTLSVVADNLEDSCAGA